MQVQSRFINRGAMFPKLSKRIPCTLKCSSYNLIFHRRHSFFKFFLLNRIYCIYFCFAFFRSKWEINYQQRDYTKISGLRLGENYSNTTCWRCSLQSSLFINLFTQNRTRNMNFNSANYAEKTKRDKHIKRWTRLNKGLSYNVDRCWTRRSFHFSTVTGTCWRIFSDITEFVFWFQLPTTPLSFLFSLYRHRHWVTCEVSY